MKVRKELWFGFIIMGLIIAGTAVMLLSADRLTSGHLGLMMLSLVVVAIMLGFPTAFTLMGMGMLFTWLAYERDTTRTLDLMVQSAFKVMSNDVLISIPLFVFMGYLVERANLIERLFRSLHLAMARVPGSLSVATLVTCAVFATATGIVGAVVTLMGLLAMPQMLKGGYDVRIAAGSITAGGCLGILIPPSVLLIVYGATAGVSVVQLYAGAFFPGLMLAGLYIVYVVVLAKIRPAMMPPLTAEQRRVELPAPTARIAAAVSNRALPALAAALGRAGALGVPREYVRKQLGVALIPAAVFLAVFGLAWHVNTVPRAVEAAPTAAGSGLSLPAGAVADSAPAGGAQEPPGAAGGLQEPPGVSDDAREASGGLAAPPGSEDGVREPAGADAGLREPAGADAMAATPAEVAERRPASTGFWIGAGTGLLALVVFYALLSFQRLEIFKMLLASFFPLMMLILAVLGSIVFGLATPTEAAAVGAFGGYLLAAVYSIVGKRPSDLRRRLLIWLLLWLPALAAIGWFALYGMGVVAEPVSGTLGVVASVGVGLWALLAYRQSGLKDEVKESVFLTAKTSAMVCWLFVGSAIFSAAFALLGGQELVENWVLSLGLSKIEFLLLSQVIIFILGWPLEWTEIIVIFMPIFIPLLDNFGIDPLFFGLLVALNLQTAFLSPPVAMAAFYLKGVSPPHVTLNQIFAGMLPFMGIQIVAIFLLYVFPEIGLWLPSVLYGR
jgi:TRAP-type mannitol/chloroaromatic compound transport system permease large subunit